MSAYTKGPWLANVLDNGHYTVSTEGWRNICQLARNSEPEAANARLIAAAPDLLWALKRIVSDLPTNRDWLDPDVEQYAIAAIAKAEAK